MNRLSIRAAFGVAVLAALASLSQAAHARDPGLNQPGRAGNVVAPAARVATPGVGAPGVGARDPGINQPGAIGNRGVVLNAAPVVSRLAG